MEIIGKLLAAAVSFFNIVTYVVNNNLSFCSKKDNCGAINANMFNAIMGDIQAQTTWDLSEEK